MSVAHTHHGHCHTYLCHGGQGTDTGVAVGKVDDKVAAGCAAERWAWMGLDDDVGHEGVEDLGVGWSPEGVECPDGDEARGVVRVGEWMFRL